MSNEKKNPLIGAFRAPPAGMPVSPAQPMKQADTPKDGKPVSAAPAPAKPEEIKKPAEQKTLADAIEKEGVKVPSKTEAVKLKEEPCLYANHAEVREVGSAHEAGDRPAAEGHFSR